MKKAKKPANRKGRTAKQMAQARAAAKRQGKTGGRPKKTPSEKHVPGTAAPDAELEALVDDYAEHGAEPEDIALLLGLDARMNEDTEFRAWFEKRVAVAHAKMKTKIARQFIKDSLDGKVTAQVKSAEAYLTAFMDEAPMRDFASGTPDKILTLIEKAKKRRKEGKGPAHA